jgi:hypothetical protein
LTAEPPRPAGPRSGATVAPSAAQPCINNALCLSVGHNTEFIYTFFDKFSWEYSLRTFYTINNGANGAVYGVMFKRDEHTAYAALKITKEQENDNLFYEACVGYYINTQLQYYPCFIKTYRNGIIQHNMYNWLLNTNEIHNYILDEITIKKSFINMKSTDELIQNFNEKIKSSCKHSLYNCILIENLPNTPSLGDRINTLNLSNIYCILFQVYSVLNQLKDEFTHYDLSAKNVLLYYVKTINKEDACILMNYHTESGIISFYTNIISKIIDYGRCFFHIDDQFNSPAIKEIVCYNQYCTQPTLKTIKYWEWIQNRQQGQQGQQEPQDISFFSKCGKDKGYNWLSDDTNEYYIHPEKPNRSHDLYLLSILKQNYEKTNRAVPDFFKNVVYENILTHPPPAVHASAPAPAAQPPQWIIGAPEDMTSTPPAIRNVYDAYIELSKIINNPNFVLNKQSLPLIGTLDVYLNEKKPMRWQPAEGVTL